MTKRRRTDNDQYNDQKKKDSPKDKRIENTIKEEGQTMTMTKRRRIDKKKDRKEEGQIIQ